MPAFDPVRDAVLNSPLTTSPPLPPSMSHRNSPALPRRATDLSMLLNNAAPPPPIRSNSLSHLLLPDHPDDHHPPPPPSPEEKLARIPPLQRHPSPDSSRIPPSSPEDLFTPSVERSYFSFPHPPPPESPYSNRSTGTIPQANSRPSTSSSTHMTGSPVMPPPPAPTNSTSRASQSPTAASREPPLMYNPRRRTPATSVLVPLSPEEMQMYQQLGAGTRRLSKRKRFEGDEHESEADAERRIKRSRDTGLVIEHYNARPEVGVQQRRESPIIGLRNFNNWIKSVLITRFAHPALQEARTERGGGRGMKGRGKVLDMGCGKGGDLSKWSKARIREYVGVDIAAISIDQARGRYDSLSPNTRPPLATFAALDCYIEPLTRALPRSVLPQSLDAPDVPPFDVVSMQFCMHYAFESVQKARCMLENASRWLRKGGVFIGTIPNADQLLQRLDALPPDTPSSDLSFGNSIYKIRFEDRTNRPLFGHRYWFFLRDAVEDVPEYIVQWDNFVQLASEYGFHPVYKREFHEVFEEHQDHAEFGPLMERMKVVDSNGESQMDEDQWEAANIYIAFAMEKR